jgi:hypothetical protein
MAAFQVFDLEVSRRVFSVCGTSTRVFALDEQLGAWGAGEPFIYMVESPYEDFDDDFTRLRACEITLDRGKSTAAWRVDGRTVYETHGTFIPERRDHRNRAQPRAGVGAPSGDRGARASAGGCGACRPVDHGLASLLLNLSIEHLSTLVKA